MGELHPLMQSQVKEKFATIEIVGVSHRQPNAGRDFALLVRKFSAAVELGNNSGAPRDVVGQFGFGADERTARFIDPRRAVAMGVPRRTTHGGSIVRIGFAIQLYDGAV